MFYIHVLYRFINNVLSTGQQVWLRKLGGAKPAVSENANGIITAGRAKRSASQPERTGDRLVLYIFRIFYLDIWILKRVSLLWNNCQRNRFRQLKEDEKKKKVSKAMTSEEAQTSESVSDSEEESDEETNSVVNSKF